MRSPSGIGWAPVRILLLGIKEVECSYTLRTLFERMRHRRLDRRDLRAGFQFHDHDHPHTSPSPWRSRRTPTEHRYIIMPPPWGMATFLFSQDRRAFLLHPLLAP